MGTTTQWVTRLVVIGAIVAQLLVGACRPKPAESIDDILDVGFSRDGLTFTGEETVVADGLDKIFVRVKLPDDVTPRKVKLRSVLGKFANGTSEAEATTDPQTHAALFTLTAGVTAGVDLLTASITLTTDTGEQTFQRVVPVRYLRSCPELVYFTIQTRPEIPYKTGSLQIKAKAIRLDESTMTKRATTIGFTVAHQTAGKDPGYFFPSIEQVANDNGEVEVQLFAGQNGGRVTLTATAKCQPDPIDDSVTITRDATMVVAYTGDASAPL